MRAVVIFAVVLLVLLIAYVTLTGNDPEPADEMIDGRTGEIEQVDE